MIRSCRSCRLLRPATVLWTVSRCKQQQSGRFNFFSTLPPYHQLDSQIVEYWRFTDDAVHSRFVPLGDFESEFAKGKLGQEPAGNPDPAVATWFLFKNINDVSIAALKSCFKLDAGWELSLSAPARIEFVHGPEKKFDHLLVNVHDYRLQDNDDDAIDGYVDDLTWIREIYDDAEDYDEGQPPAGYKDEQNDVLEAPPEWVAQRMVSKAVRFYYFPSTNTLITIGTDSAFMVQAGRAAILNGCSQVPGMRARRRARMHAVWGRGGNSGGREMEREREGRREVSGPSGPRARTRGALRARMLAVSGERGVVCAHARARLRVRARAPVRPCMRMRVQPVVYTSMLFEDSASEREQVSELAREREDLHRITRERPVDQRGGREGGRGRGGWEREG
jgi:hypothetical protein